MKLDALFEKSPKTSQCRFGKQFAALSDEDQNKIKIAFQDNEITTSWIFKVLSENGFPVSESTVRTHRKGNCRTCGKIV